MFSLVATERRDARPGGRAAGPGENPNRTHLVRGGLSARIVGLRTTRMHVLATGFGEAEPI
jgi:hypothetical protein